MRIEINKNRQSCPFGRKLKDVGIGIDSGGEYIININYTWWCPECQYFVDRKFYDTSYTKGYVICKHTTLKDRLTLAKELIK
jgi:hypothetical protein